MSDIINIDVTTPPVVQIEIASRGVPGSGASLSDDDPENLGATNPGASEKASRADHIHGMPSATNVGAYTITSYFAELDTDQKKSNARSNLGIEIIDCGTF